MILVYDTETSGLPNWKEPSSDPAQPFIVSLAVVKLGDLSLDESGHQHFLLKPPPGRTIPDEVAKIHGITTERAMDEGVDPEAALVAFCDARRRAVATVAHNEPFDRRMMRIELLRHGRDKPWIEALESCGSVVCTQRLATPVLNIPPTVKMVKAGFNKPEAASLADCLRYMFNEDIADAHDALADARNCGRVYKWLAAHGHITKIGTKP